MKPAVTPLVEPEDRDTLAPEASASANTAPEREFEFCSRKRPPFSVIGPATAREEPPINTALLLVEMSKSRNAEVSNITC